MNLKILVKYCPMQTIYEDNLENNLQIIEI